MPPANLIAQLEETCGVCMNAPATREIDDLPVCEFCTDDQAQALLDEMNRDMSDRVDWETR